MTMRESTVSLEVALEEIAAEADDLDREPRFPSRAFALLGAAGSLRATVGGDLPVATEWSLVRRVAAADGSVGRIFDGHLNAVERIRIAAPAGVSEDVLARVSDGESLLGVWGADPGPGEGEPARLHGTGDSLVLDGAKTFCSGAGGVDGALVMVGSGDGTAPSLVFVEIDDSVVIDRGWYRGSGLRASESHRVIFRSAPVRAVLGEPGELSREPWFSRDAMRTAASWAGMADRAADFALADLAARRRGDAQAEAAAGRIMAARGTIDHWLAAGASLADGAGEETDLKALGVSLRLELARAIESILADAAGACGSHPFATGTALDRARRDVQLFLLQHRLDPLAARSGAALLASIADRPVPRHDRPGE